jgi:hypothetical protein
LLAQILLEKLFKQSNNTNNVQLKIALRKRIINLAPNSAYGFLAKLGLLFLRGIFH